MSIVLIVTRLALALVFAAAATTKLADRERLRATLGEFNFCCPNGCCVYKDCQCQGGLP
jgi:hypothetical protein